MPTSMDILAAFNRRKSAAAEVKAPVVAPVPSVSSQRDQERTKMIVEEVRRCHFLSLRALRRALGKVGQTFSIEGLRYFATRASAGEAPSLGIVDPEVARSFCLTPDVVYARDWIVAKASCRPYCEMGGAEHPPAEQIIAATLFDHVKDPHRVPTPEFRFDMMMQNVEIEPGVFVDWDNIVDLTEKGLICFYENQGRFQRQRSNLMDPSFY